MSCLPYIAAQYPSWLHPSRELQRGLNRSWRARLREDKVREGSARRQRQELMIERQELMIGGRTFASWEDRASGRRDQASRANRTTTARVTPNTERPATTEASQTTSRTSSRMNFQMGMTRPCFADYEVANARQPARFRARLPAKQSSRLRLLLFELLEKLLEPFRNGFGNNVLKHGPQLTADMLAELRTLPVLLRTLRARRPF